MKSGEAQHSPRWDKYTQKGGATSLVNQGWSAVCKLQKSRNHWQNNGPGSLYDGWWTFWGNPCFWIIVSINLAWQALNWWPPLGDLPCSRASTVWQSSASVVAPFLGPLCLYGWCLVVNGGGEMWPRTSSETNWWFHCHHLLIISVVLHRRNSDTSSKKEEHQLEQINFDATQAVQPKAGQVSNQIFYQRSATMSAKLPIKVVLKKGWNMKLSAYPLVNEHSWINIWSLLIANTSSSGPFCIAMSIYQSVVAIQFRSNLVWPFSGWLFAFGYLCGFRGRRTPMKAPFRWEVFAGGISWHSK